MRTVEALAGALIAAGIVVDVVFLAVHRRRINWSVRLALVRSRPWVWQDASVILIALGFAYAACLILLRAFGCSVDGPPEDVRCVVLAQSLLFYGTAGVALLVLKRGKQVSWADGFGLSLRAVAAAVRPAALFYLGALPPLVLLGLLWQFLLVRSGFPVDSQEAVRLFVQPHPVAFRVYMSILAVAMAPALEEMLFRGMALPILARRFHPAVAVLLVSVVFAAVHFHVPSFVPLTVIASAFCLAYIVTGSLAAPILMHGLFNALNLVALVLLKDMPGSFGS